MSWSRWLQVLYFLTSRIFSLDFHCHCFKNPNAQKCETISQSPTAWLTSTRILTLPYDTVPQNVRIIGQLWILLCPGRFQSASGVAQLGSLIICSVSIHSQKYLMQMPGHAITRQYPSGPCLQCLRPKEWRQEDTGAWSRTQWVVRVSHIFTEPEESFAKRYLKHYEIIVPFCSQYIPW